MKKIAFLFLIFSLAAKTVLAFEAPNPTGYVNDFVGIFTEEERQALEEKISLFEQRSTNEIAVAIIPSLDGDAIENVAQEIFTKWEVGKKDKDNGVLVVVSMAERQMRIHTGYGVEGVLTDIGTARIQDEIMRPAFREENYAAGINAAVDTMISALEGDPGAIPEPKKDINISGIFDLGFFFVFVVLPWLGSGLARSKSWWAGGVIGGALGLVNLIFGIFSSTILGGGIILALLAGIGFFLDYVVSKRYNADNITGAHHPWWTGGGWGSGGGFGGFGGFGGGSSGGGGSSSSW